MHERLQEYSAFKYKVMTIEEFVKNYRKIICLLGRKGIYIHPLYKMDTFFEKDGVKTCYDSLYI